MNGLAGPGRGRLSEFASDIISHRPGAPDDCLLELTNIQPGSICSAECFLYIPVASKIKSIGLAFFGFETITYKAPDLSVLDEWQKVHVSSLVPLDQSKARLRLSVEADGIVDVFSSEWKLSSSGSMGKTQPIEIRWLASLVETPTTVKSAGTYANYWTSPGKNGNPQICEIQYGQISEPEFSIIQYPKNSWNSSEFESKELRFYKVENAIVHGEQGLVELGEFAVGESVRLVSFDEGSLFRRVGEKIFVPKKNPTIVVNRGVHLFSGFPGNRNYAHWLVDIMPGLVSALSEPDLGDTLLLLPETKYKWQRDVIDLFPELKIRSVFVAEEAVVGVTQLLFCPHLLRDPGHSPTQAVKLFSSETKKRLSLDFIQPRRRIYISRKDTSARRLVNEDELISRLVDFGFEIVSLSGMLFAEQVSIFSESEIVVAAHGAGLANIMFCNPGTKLLELFIDSYVQWSMRRLASLVPVRYGCLVGREQGYNPGQQGKVWKIDISQVETTIMSML